MADHISAFSGRVGSLKKRADRLGAVTMSDTQATQLEEVSSQLDDAKAVVDMPREGAPRSPVTKAYFDKLEDAIARLESELGIRDPEQPKA